MTRYAVLLHARGISLLNEHRQQKPGGMYTWRVVQASSPRDAEQQARGALLKENAFLEEIWDTPEEGQIKAEEIEVLENPDAEDGGFVFYFDDPDDEVLKR